MCVTNIAKRRNVAVEDDENACRTPSLISQRLMSNFMPLMMNTSVAKPFPSTELTRVPVDAHFPSSVNGTSNTVFSHPRFMMNSEEPKVRPRRRRKPQKPGKTAKQNDRHFVVHDYHDHAFDPDENDDEDDEPRRRGGVSVSFPTKLHMVLEQLEIDGWGHVISWQPHGRCFVIHKPREFADHVLPHYFRQNKLTSFQRQLNLYGFSRLTKGKDSGGYYHEYFLRGRLFLTKKMQRTKIKGTKFKAASSPDLEPDFYSMPPVLPVQSVSDDSSADDSHILDRQSPVGVVSETGSNIFQSGSFPVSPTLAYEHAFVQAPQPAGVLTPSAFSLLTGISAPCSSNRTMQQGDQMRMHVQMMAFSMDSSADSVLDQAVDELFNSESNLPDLNESDFDRIWDNNEFGQDSHEEDLQLGFLLDKLLDSMESPSRGIMGV